MMRAFFRVTIFGFQDMVRNAGLSLMTVLILIVMLLSMHTLISLRVLTEKATDSIKSRIDFSIYVSPDTTSDELSEITSYVQSFPEVTELTVLTPDQSLEQFRGRYADNTDVLTALDELGENPLGSSLVVKTREPSDVTKIMDGLTVPEYAALIDERTFADTGLVIQRIESVTSRVEIFTIVLTGFFAFIAFLIIFNTIRVAIYTQRREISIKKLVGATNWFIRGPYLIESVVFSLISVAVATTAVILFLQASDPFVSAVFEESGVLTSYYSSHILLLISLQLAVVLVLTTLTSMLAMRRHLNV